MKAIKLNENWNAEPNVPEPQIDIEDNDLYLSFSLNHFTDKSLKKGQKGQLIFKDCYIYRLGSVNDEGFSMGQFRYGPEDMKWGGFYELIESDWKSTFSDDKVLVNKSLKDDDQLKHYLFFFRDETFECIAKGYELKK